MTRPSNVFLIGPMGAGKTTIGKRLAARLGKRFVDSDQEIETRTGTTIPIIFDIEGEEGFRKRESQVIAELATEKNIVMATGGGSILIEENRQTLSRHGLIIYLEINLEEQLRRTQKSTKRPLLNTENRREKLEQLAETRNPLYQSIAEITITSNQQKPQLVVNEIMQLITKDKLC